jgi:hypothetical protein
VHHVAFEKKSLEEKWREREEEEEEEEEWYGSRILKMG